MTIHCLGSINVDHVHRVPHFPQPGETLGDLSYVVGLGGKGANQAIAVARAGGDLRFIGATGPDGGWVRGRLADAGLGLSQVADVEAATGHAVIMVDPAGENVILLHGGANRTIPDAAITAAQDSARPGDWWLTQNETNGVFDSTVEAKRRGLRTAHVAAPFDAMATAPLLPHLDLLAVNEGEAVALAAHLGVAVGALPVPSLLVTLGARGASWRDAEGEVTMPAFPVEAVDTTGAGDTFLGYALAALDGGADPEAALRRAAAAAALSVMREGAADAIPTRAQVDAFLEDQP